MKKIIKILVYCLIVAIMSVSCGPKITRGVIIEKTYYPSGIYLYPLRVGDVTVLTRQKFPSQCKITVETKNKVRSYIIDKETYESVNCGDTVVIKKLKNKHGKTNQHTVD